MRKFMLVRLGSGSRFHQRPDCDFRRSSCSIGVTPSLFTLLRTVSVHGVTFAFRTPTRNERSAAYGARAGEPASLLVRMFGETCQSLGQFPLTLNGG